MATKYRAIITIADNHEVVEASTPAALGTKIGEAISADPRNDVTLVYEVTGPTSRRMS